MIASTRVVNVRQMCPNDFGAVFEIEQRNAKHAWTKQQISESLQCTQVLIVDQKLAGFVVLRTIIDQAELQNISIHNDCQLLGYGEYLLNHGINNLADSVNQVYLEVRVSNFSAIRLYNKMGFLEMGQRRDYYPTEFGREDALTMCLGIV